MIFPLFEQVFSRLTSNILNVELPAGFTLTAANPTLRVYTGSGTNAPGVIYTGRLSGVWSNLRDDCARLVDPAGGQWRFDLGNGCP